MFNTCLIRHLFFFQCSYYPSCRSSQSANEETVNKYEAEYGSVGLSYPCLYNPGNPREVIRTRRFHLHNVVSGMTWSSLLLLVSVIALYIMIKKRGCKVLWLMYSTCIIVWNKTNGCQSCEIKFEKMSIGSFFYGKFFFISWKKIINQTNDI